MNHIKHKIARFLFADEIKKIEIERETFKVVSKCVEDDKEMYMNWVEKRTVTDMCREKLAGFDFKENKKDFISSIPEDEIMDYLQKAVSIKESNVFNFVIDYMTRKQIEVYSNEAINLEKINFGRATLNGIALIDEAIEELSDEYARRIETDEDFDKHLSV